MKWKVLVCVWFALCSAAAYAQTTETANEQDTSSVNTQSQSSDQAISPQPNESATGGQATDTESMREDSTMANAEGTDISDEDLRKYAVTMDSVNDMKAALLEEISTMVKNNKSMKASRYNELSKIINDEEKLKAAKATQEEISFIMEVNAKKEAGTARIMEVFQTMARDYVGAENYNKIKEALETDSSLKERYQTVLKEVESEDKG